MDFTPGMSGAPVYAKDEHLLRYIKTHNPQFKSFKLDKMMFAIHTGWDKYKGLNYGTFITSEINMWIQNSIIDYHDAKNNQKQDDGKTVTDKLMCIVPVKNCLKM